MSDTMKAPAHKRTPTADEDDSTARGRPGRKPRAQNDDCTHTYADGPLRRIDSEDSPSTGWRGVYAAMGVGVR